jgi:imidazolonepropionase-like amidohydrolase
MSTSATKSRSVGAATNLADAIARLAVESRTRPVWVRVGQLIDGVAATPLHSANLVFDADSIRFVGSEQQLPEPAHLAAGRNAPDAILPHATLLPTLIEAHAHLFLDGAPVDAQQREEYLQRPADWMLGRGRARWSKILACGVGAVRDAGDKHGVGLALAAESKTQHGGRRTTPLLDSPGAAIHHRGRYGSFMGEPIENYRTEAECVAARVAAGADRIKLLVSGIINFKAGRVTTTPQMSAEEVGRIVVAARRCVRQTFAHASGTDGVENAIVGGVTTVEHGFFITREQLARMRDQQIGWVPTFAPVAVQFGRAAELDHDPQVVGHLERILAGHADMLCHAHEIGVSIVAGSDAGSCGVPHGIGLVDELVQMERAGLPPLAVIQSATGVSARVLDFPDPIGRIAPGCRARMVFTTHDPCQAVANLHKEKTILFDGQVIHCPHDLDSIGL